MAPCSSSRPHPRKTKTKTKTAKTLMVSMLTRRLIVMFQVNEGQQHRSKAQRLTHDIESAWNHQRVATFLCIDVKGFFDNVNHDRLVRVMWEKGFPIPIVKWVRSFLTERSTAISLDGSTLPFAPVNIGIPQGSPVSPVLSIIYASEVIEKLISHPSIPVAPKAYIDDLGILAISSSLQDNVSTLEKAFHHTVHSLAEIGMTIDPTKLELQHFSRRPTDSVLPALHVDTDGSPITVTAPKTLRWLGFFLDKRLSFRMHVKIMANRASSVINGLRCLGNTVRGLSQSNFRVLYRTCALPIMTYGSPLWYRKGRRISGLVKSLDVTQNRALRLIAGAFRTAPIELLQLRCHIPPIHIWLDKVSESSANRLLKLHHLSPIVQRLPNIWREGKRPIVPTPYSTPHKLGNRLSRRTSLQQLSSLSDPSSPRLLPFHSDNAPWTWTPGQFNGRLSINPSTCSGKDKEALVKSINLHHFLARNRPGALFIYCDGSRHGTGPRNTRTSYAVTIYNCAKPIFTIQIGLGTQSTVFDAEAYAIAHAIAKVKTIMDPSTIINEVHIYSDSSSAIRTSLSPSTHPAQPASLLFRTTARHLLNAFPGLSISIAWSPGHSQVLGNERVDELAKESVNLPPMLPCTPSFLKERLKIRARTRWQRIISQWRKEPHNGSHKKESGPHRSPLIPQQQFRSMPRELFGRITQIATGHGYFGEYYQRFVPSCSPYCVCTDPTSPPIVETREHILFDCPRYAMHRPILKNRPLANLLNPDLGLDDLTKFLRKSGAFTRDGRPRPDPPLLVKKKPPDKKR